MHIGLLDNDAFRRLSPEARLTFLVSIMLAGKQNQGGRLEIRSVGPMTVCEIASYTNISERKQQAALDELTQAVGFLGRDLTGTYFVERFKEKADPSDPTHAARQKRYRDGKRDASRDGASDGTSNASLRMSRDETEEDVEEDITPRTIVLGAQWLKSDGRPEGWLGDLHDAFWSITAKQVRYLSIEERDILARTHAAVLGNASVDERKNRTKAASLAAPIAHFGGSKLGDITCEMYLRYGVKALEIRGGRPFWNPFDIEAGVEYEPT